MGYCTHLTIYWSRNVHSYKAKNQADKAGQTCDRVNLPNESISSRPCRQSMPGETKAKCTNPYRPPVREMASNNLPFIVKGGKILPARQGGLKCVKCGKKLR